MKKIKTIVAGTTFGQFYMGALKYVSDDFEFAGILASGSDRSKNLAKKAGVPLYHKVSELPEDIDLACVVIRSSALGGKGTDLSIELMERGISVIQEQPLHYKELSHVLKIAKKNKVFFHMGDLYVNVPMVRQFAAAAKELLKKQKLLYIEASCSTQVSYPLVDILTHILPTIHPFKIKNVDKNSGPFHIVTADIANVPIIFLIHNEMDPDDPDNFMHLLQRITFGTTAGRLCLYDTHGPLVWHNRLHVPTSLYNEAPSGINYPEYLNNHSRYSIGDTCEKSYIDIITKDWRKAISKDLLMMKGLMDGTVNRNYIGVKALNATEVWHEITNKLGYAALNHGLTHESLDVEDLRRAAESEMEREEIVDTNIETSTHYGDRFIEDVTKEEIDRFAQNMEEAVCHTMLGTLKNMGAFKTDQSESLQDVMETCAIKPDYDYILERWMMLLEKNQFLVKTEDGYQCIKQPETDFKEKWKSVKEIWNNKLGNPKAVEYLLLNVDHLEELLRGEINATNILFYEGKTDYADALYSETVTTRFSNQSVGEAIIRYAVGREQLEILEVGAGTGSTTKIVAPRLDKIKFEKKIHYAFTDVSEYFLENAKSNFSKYDFINEYFLFDINKDILDQGIQRESKDIILAAGVINNAEDSNQVIHNLLCLLKKGGLLILTEPTGEFPEILISQAFMATRPLDERYETNTTFLTDLQWRNIFGKQNISKLYVLPEEGHKLSALNQKIYILEK